MRLLRAITMMLLQWLDVITALLFGRLDRWSLWLLILPLIVAYGVYAGIVTIAEAGIYALLYCANIAVRAWIASRNRRVEMPDEKTIFE